MIQLELMKTYKAKAKGHPERLDGTESIGDFVPIYEHTEHYEAQRFVSQVFTNYVNILKVDGRISGRDGLTHWYVEGDTPTLPYGYTRKCDCGGFKTYNSYHPEFHSTWCEVLR